MSRRLLYENAQPIAEDRRHMGCDTCTLTSVAGPMVDGMPGRRKPIHERGCPNAWRDSLMRCPMCGRTHRPTRAEQETCCADD